MSAEKETGSAAAPSPAGAASRPTPRARPEARSFDRRRGPRSYLGLALLLAAATIGTVWNLTRSDELERARAANIRRDLAASLNSALDHLDRRPWSREAALIAARSLSLLDFAEQAEPYYRRAGRLTLDDLQVRAYALVRGNHRERAVRAYEEILERWPDNVTALRRLAAVQLSRNDNGALLRLGERLIRIPGGAAVGYTLLGVVYHNDESHEAAAAAFERVLDSDPSLRGMPLPKQLFWTHLGQDLAAVGRMSDARRHLARAVAESPDPVLMNMLGRACELDGDPDEAERCWRQAADWDPDDPAPLLQLGKSAYRRGRYGKALEFLTRAAAHAPRHYEIAYQLSLTYRKLGRQAEAEHYRKTADELRAKSSGPAAGAPTPSAPRFSL
jgi:tetratricopeptide (TPR) repeat protein